MIDIIPAHVVDKANRRTDPQQIFLQLGPHCMRESRRMRQFANHYSDVRVGAVALSLSAEGDVGLFKGANQNLEPGDNPSKICAERVALQKMIDKEFGTMLAMFVSGPVQPTTQSGLETPTLHSCGLCQAAMHDHQHVVPAAAPIVTVHPARDAYEIHGNQEYQLVHANAGQLGVPFSYQKHDPDFGHWQTALRAHEIGDLPMAELDVTAAWARTAIIGPK